VFNSETSINRRLSILFIITLIITVAFAWRLAEFQIVHADTLREEAADKREMGSILYGQRGYIYDRNGLILAESVTRFHLTADPTNVKDYKRQGETITVDNVIATISEVTLVPIEEIETLLLGDPDKMHVYLAKNLTLEQINQVNQMRAPYLYSEKIETRNYPNGHVASNLIGFMGTDGPLAGLELKYETCLKGENGRQVFERSADGVRVPGSTIVVEEPKIGEDLSLTIDADLQWFAQSVLQQQGESLQAEWGHIIVVDSATGEVLTAADWPTIDANNPAGYPEEHRGSKIFISPYEPGSTIKTLSYALAVEQAGLNSSEQLVIPPYYQVTSEHRISDAFEHDYVQYTAAGVLVYSSNIGMSMIGERLTAEQVFGKYLQFGLGSETNIEFPGESAGKIFTPQEIDRISEKTQIFGQGMTTTAIQIAGAYQTIANDGMKKPLTLVKGCGEPEETAELQVVSPEAAKEVQEVLEEVVEQGILKDSVKKEGYQIAAKTGTAEVASGGQYTNDRVISIAGYVQGVDTNYVVVTTFGKPQTIRYSSGAIPAFNEMISYIINKYNIPPSEDTIEYQLKW
jgi:cell division protein FtsI (penicillin-binding protein 3)